MQSYGKFLRLAGILALLAAGGCNGTQTTSSMADRPSRNPGDFASRSIPSAQVATVRPVAADVFRSGYRLDPTRSTGDTLISRPAEVTGKQKVERVRDVLGRPNRHRSTAILRMTQNGPAVLVQCQVRLERLDTVEQAAFARSTGDDRPNETPIERLGADTGRPREVWVYVNRDRQAEAAILDAIAHHFVSTQPAGQ
jgi:hypothetical protein